MPPISAIPPLETSSPLEPSSQTSAEKSLCINNPFMGKAVQSETQQRQEKFPWEQSCSVVGPPFPESYRDMNVTCNSGALLTSTIEKLNVLNNKKKRTKPRLPQPPKELGHLNHVAEYNIKMNQQCKVCGEPAAGFHFGAFTCEGCKSFFGRSYNNLNSISECKNNGECVINKKNRTACKACRLRKCLMVGMSKSGSRYGRRSNWFKIHCLLQEQQQQAQQQQQQQSHGLAPPGSKPPQRTPPPPNHPSLGYNLLGSQQFPPSSLMHLPRTKEELLLLGIDDYKHAASPSVSSPESHNSDSSVEVSDGRRIPMFPGLIPSPFLPHPGLLFPSHFPPLYPGLLQPVNNNNNRLMRNHNPGMEALNKRLLLDAVLQSQRTPTPPEPARRVEVEEEEDADLSDYPQEDPIDLSMKTSERGSSPAGSIRSGSEATERGAGSEADEESDCDTEREFKRLKVLRPTPLDLTTKV